MQDSTFRLNVVLLLAKTGPPVRKNFPLRRLFPTDVMMTRRFYTPYDVKCTNLHILTARGMSHNFDSDWSTSKLERKFVRACPQPKLENYE